jgi:hypothetical protein
MSREVNVTCVLIYWQRATDPVISAVYAKFIKPNREKLPNDTVEGFRRLCGTSNYAFMTHTTTFIQFKNYVTCDTVEVPKASLLGFAAFVLPQNSVYGRFLKRK